MSELLIRPSLQDHKVLADLLAPSPLGGRRPIDRVVLNAQDAARNGELADAARHAGAALLVDPNTPLIQGAIDPSDPWAKLPFGVAEARSPEDLGNPFMLDELVAAAVEFQVDRGATAIVAPYFYVESPASTAFAATRAAIARTARRMRIDGVALPLIAVLCARLQGFGGAAGGRALDEFAAASLDVGPQALALELSPVGDGRESYAKLLNFFGAARRVRAAGASVLAWRQGVYGPALVAAGLDGYETGIGVCEATNVASYINARKPRKDTGGGYAAHGVYLAGLRRSVPINVARVLLADRVMRGRVVCDEIRCCPRGAESMLAAGGRRHAVRARARELAELEEMPSAAWRLNHIAKQAASGYVTAAKANEALAATDLPNRIKTEGYAALEQVAEFIRTHNPDSVRESA